MRYSEEKVLLQSRLQSRLQSITDLGKARQEPDATIHIHRKSRDWMNACTTTPQLTLSTLKQPTTRRRRMFPFQLTQSRQPLTDLPRGQSDLDNDSSRSSSPVIQSCADRTIALALPIQPWKKLFPSPLLSRKSSSSPTRPSQAALSPAKAT